MLDSEVESSAMPVKAGLLRICAIALFAMVAPGCREAKQEAKSEARSCAFEALLMDTPESKTYYLKKRSEFEIAQGKSEYLCIVSESYPDDPKFDVLRHLGQSGNFHKFEAKWVECVQTAGRTWSSFKDPLFESGNLAGLAISRAEFTSRRLESTRTGIPVPVHYRSQYLRSLKDAIPLAREQSKVDVRCRETMRKAVMAEVSSVEAMGLMGPVP